MASVTKARRARERSARESLILEHARRLLRQGGFQDLNLDVLAESVEYSKGTLYLHFETKEDLVLAVATQALQARGDLFEKASRFNGGTRERFRAIGVASAVFAQANHDFFHLETMIKSPSFWEKTSEERRRQHGVQAARIFHIMNGVVVDALRLGDLPPTVSPPSVTLSLIALSVGAHMVGMQPDLQMLAGITNPMASIRQFQDVLCDGWGWKPLHDDAAAVATERRIRTELFPEANWLPAG